MTLSMGAMYDLKVKDRVVSLKKIQLRKMGWMNSNLCARENLCFFVHMLPYKLYCDILKGI